HLHRAIGCEYVNAYNIQSLPDLKCNHDAQFVLGTGVKNIAANVIKYCFKNQNPVENQAALSLIAFAKAAQKANKISSDTSAMEQGYRLLGSMLYTVTNGQEVDVPLSALYILCNGVTHKWLHVATWLHGGSSNIGVRHTNGYTLQTIGLYASRLPIGR
ncbi:hypothetical protein JG688_00004883, partial [Phytophthora aleatoria]